MGMIGNLLCLFSVKENARSLVQEIFPDRVKDFNHHSVFEYFG